MEGVVCVSRDAAVPREGSVDRLAERRPAVTALELVRRLCQRARFVAFQCDHALQIRALTLEDDMLLSQLLVRPLRLCRRGLRRLFLLGPLDGYVRQVRDLTIASFLENLQCEMCRFPVG